MQGQVVGVVQSAHMWLGSSSKNRELQFLIALCGSLARGVGKGSAGWDVSDKASYVTQRHGWTACAVILAVNINLFLCHIRL